MKQVAVGIITKDGRVLVCQRQSAANYPLKWEFPGGKLEPSEVPEHALSRELHEELGVDAVIGPEFHRQEWIYGNSVSDPDNDGAFRVFYFLISSFSGMLTNKAFEQVRWVTPRELQNMDILEGNREAVNLLARYVEQRQEA